MAKDRIVLLPSMNESRICHGSVAIGSKVYVYGGWDMENNRGLCSMEVYDISEDERQDPNSLHY